MFGARVWPWPLGKHFLVQQWHHDGHLTRTVETVVCAILDGCLMWLILGLSEKKMPPIQMDYPVGMAISGYASFLDTPKSHALLVVSPVEKNHLFFFVPPSSAYIHTKLSVNITKKMQVKFGFACALNSKGINATSSFPGGNTFSSSKTIG